MPKIVLEDDAGSFEATLLDPGEPERVVLFGVGAGGNPERHQPLLQALAEAGNLVVAPHHERLASPTPTAAELRRRAARLELALRAGGHRELPVAGVGHSIGAAMLLGLAGGRLWAFGGHEVAMPPVAGHIDRLVLLAPATDFFRVPGALAFVEAEVLVWVGTKDDLAPPARVRFLAEELAPRVSVVLRSTENAGHFSFMHVPPPHQVEPLADRDTFLNELTQAVCRFCTA